MDDVEDVAGLLLQRLVPAGEVVGEHGAVDEVAEDVVDGRLGRFHDSDFWRADGAADFEAIVSEARVTLTDAGAIPDDETLIDLYRRAWVVASAAAHEGWGMTLTEAAACGTPAVATRIPGHEDAVQNDRTGLLAENEAEFAAALARICVDDALRKRLAAAARERASELTWGATARGTLEVLAAETLRSRTT